MATIMRFRNESIKGLSAQMRKNQWFKWFIIEIDKTIQQAADGRVCLRKKLTKNGLLLLDKTRFPIRTVSDPRLSHAGTIFKGYNLRESFQIVSMCIEQAVFYSGKIILANESEEYNGI